MSWNVRFSSNEHATKQGSYLKELDADLVLLQDLNAAAATSLWEAAGLDWLDSAARWSLGGVPPKRGNAAAIGARGAALLATEDPLPGAPLPERTHWARVMCGDRELKVASYYAPPGVTWHCKKVEQALAFADWLRVQAGSTLFGADGNTPLIDHPDFARTRTHWQTGSPRLEGRRGDDLLWGPEKVHQLDDALRRWLEAHPSLMNAIREERPDGPLDISHYTGRRHNSPGTPRRFDSVWVSRHFDVLKVEHRRDAMDLELSDHTPVVVDLVLTALQDAAAGRTTATYKAIQGKQGES